ncbi:MAG: VCBS repeat-containing protein [Candidatus Latescibacterota bacterium]|nr:VCBS repeat-containing protein [Candidatus Latescibacterota bacterium]
MIIGHATAFAQPLDRERLERVEDLSEELANELHDLSRILRVAGVEGTGLVPYFAEGVCGSGWPELQSAGEATPLGLIDLKPGVEVEVTDRRQMIDSWLRLLSAFGGVEDVRFKVKHAHFSDGPPLQVKADIYASFVGRDTQNRRLWIEARGKIEASRSESVPPWRIEAFSLKTLAGKRAQRDLFTEVARAAGCYHAAPPFGSSGNPGFSARGVSLADVDADGLLDAVVIGVNENFLYLNQGDGAFVNGASGAGIRVTPRASAPLVLDHDADGDVDLFLSAPGEQMLFANLLESGELQFVDVSTTAGVDRQAHGFSAVAGDVDGDGASDIYVASYNRYGIVMPNDWSRATNGTPNLLFVNDGHGAFTESAQSWGVADRRWSYAATLVDLTGEGRQDLYVANDFGENAFYRNEGERFVDIAADLGMLDPGNGMGVAVGDYDNDGNLDLHVTNMSSTAGNRILKRLFPNRASHLDATHVLVKLAAGNTLFRGLPDGGFADVSAEVGTFSAGWAWGGGFVDVDNDGWTDLHSPNGFVSGKDLKDT